MMDVASGMAGGRGATPICAVGASAGGVAALRAFFRAIPPDLGLAYVVIVHLAPDHPSVLAEILANATEMPVTQVADGPALQPDRVYVIPPDAELVIEGDDIKARPFTEPRGQRAPIDMFFRSVAAARGDGLAVVLTGAGSDGAAGVRAIKGAGGVVFVQDPDTAEYAMMPRSAIATGSADFVGDVAYLVQRIVEVIRSKAALRDLETATAVDEVRRIVSFMRSRTGHDFSSYKRATVMRRIARRMQVTRLTNLTEYAAYVRDSPEEAHNLFRDLLISVTMFFRDAQSFDVLARAAIEPIFARLDGEGGVRAWVVGCATGEEAYSVAILLLEEAARRRLRTPIQVFATDLDEGALATAREGRYPTAIEADVSEERLKRFFVRDGPHYRVRQEVRDVVLFAHHSVMKEPPFLRLDLITCRNLLIYMERDLQRQVCSLFHYGLVPNGFLFLGSAETVDTTPELFATIDRDARLYAARPGPQRRFTMLPHVSEQYGARTLPLPPRRPVVERDRSEAAIHLSALEEAAPPSVLVDRTLRILHLSPTAGRFLLPSGGTPSLELGSLVRPELRLDLQVAVQRAVEHNQTTLTLAVPVAFNGSRKRVVMNVAPVMDGGEAPMGAIVFFLEGGVVDEPGEAASGGTQELRRLHEELRAAQERLAASRSDHDVAIQELRAANEELQSINEEYRSTSEELETSKEELQSMNEELQTVNAELKSKLQSISSAHSDLQNLVAATDIGTLFLDDKLRIRMFTPKVTTLFNVTDADVGRAIGDFTHQLRIEGIEEDARRVIDVLAPVEREVETKDGRWLIMRLRPYKTIENRISGVVVTFVDVSERRQAVEDVRRGEARYRSLFDSMGEGLLFAEPVYDAAGEPVDVAYTGANPAAVRMVRADFSGRRLTQVGTGFDPAWWQIPARVLATGTPERHELFAEPLGQWFDTFVWRPDPEARQVAILFRDTTERRQAEEALKETRHLLTLATSASHLGWGTWDFSTRKATWDDRGREIIGLDRDEETAEDWLARIHPEDRDSVTSHVEDSARGGRPFDLEYRVVHRDGTVRHVHGTGTFELDAAGAPLRGTGLVRDVTEQHQWSEEQRRLVGELNHRVKNMLAVVQSVARQTEQTTRGTDEFLAAFEQRLQALAAAHALLTRRNWQSTRLDELAGVILGNFGRGDDVQVHFGGPPVEVAPNAAVFMAMAFNELATNAVKYGALSQGIGRVTLTWAATEDGRLRIVWTESGGPTVTPPTMRGFGIRMLEEGTVYELDGEVQVEFPPTGIVCTVTVPLGTKFSLAT